MIYQYFVVKEDTPVQKEIQKFFEERKALRDELYKFAESIGLETRKIDYNYFSRDIIFEPTEKDFETFKNKLSKLNEKVYIFRKNSKAGKSFKTLKKDLVIPYYRFSEMLNTKNTDTWGLDRGDIRCGFSIVDGIYLLETKAEESIKSEYLKEVTVSTYNDLKKEDKDNDR